MIDSSDGAQREERLLDAWLDAVVAAVPELVVCWSQRGVVQDIETVDTFDARSKFPGTDMLERGTSEMLSWLLRECMDENASYLVLKEKDGYAISTSYFCAPCDVAAERFFFEFWLHLHMQALTHAQGQPPSPQSRRQSHQRQCFASYQSRDMRRYLSNMPAHCASHGICS